MTKHNLSIEDRFWVKVDRSSDPEGCWLWTAGCSTRGYGSFSFCLRSGGKRVTKAHRVAWCLANGQDPETLDRRSFVCHTCDNPPCCNPAHLWLGSASDNNADRDRKNRNGIYRGEQHHLARWTESDVREMRRLRGLGSKLSFIAKQFGTDNKAVSRICRGDAWAHVAEAADGF